MSVQKACHAHIQSGARGTRQIIDHHTFTRIGFVSQVHGDGKGFGHRFAIRRDGVHIHNDVKEIIKVQRGEDTPGVVSIRICKDRFRVPSEAMTSR